jgi:hypothetical protein
MNNDIEQLKKDIQDFEIFKESILRQQVTFPLDKKSIDVVHKDVVVPTGNVIIPYSLATYDEQVEIEVYGKRYLIDTSSSY